MATENPMRLMESGRTGKWASSRGSSSFGAADELGTLRRDPNVRREQSNIAPSRSGSAPPSIEGSFAAFGNLMNQQFGARVPDHNWRLPSEDASGTGSLYVGGKSLSTHEEEPEDYSLSKGASDEGAESSSIMIGQNTLSFSGRHKSLVDLIQEDFPRTPSPIFSQTLSSSNVEEPFSHDVQTLSLDSLSLQASKSTEQSTAGFEPLSHHKEEETSNDGYSTRVLVGDDTIASDGSENLNRDEGGRDNQRLGFDQQTELHSQNLYAQHLAGYHVPELQKQVANMTSAEMQPLLQAPPIHPPLYSTAAAYMTSGSSFYPNFAPSGLYSPQYGGYALNSPFVPPYLTGYPPQTGYPLQFNPSSGQSFSGQNVANPDPLSMRYLQHLMQDPYNVPVQYSHYPPPGMIGSQVDSFALRNDLTSPAAYTGDQKYPLSPREIGLPSSNYLSSPSGLGFVPQSPLGSPVMPGSPIGGAGRRYSGGFSQTSPRNAGGYAKWQGQRGVDNVNDHRRHSFLEELKSSGAQRIDLADIFGRIVEFSVDQHGSRFIQQKLESCSVEEKEAVFKEILPHAPKLITDVFGNYVIQKFFEHGSFEQRKELASQLSGHMLPLSLQMYGCRVIQKALEVIELEQKIKLVFELDGHVIRCVRDQNGNHVIQKCIECLPTAKLDFIISAFEGQVATLSTHPYGCRVIQRVLEHCSDDLQCRSIVNEILGSTIDLAQDQYGNYVIQHVLERGKPSERGRIVGELSGKIVQMSQHKYASNVVEKCLEFGDTAQRELLIDEILAQTDDLLAMMKDQFANYVVQKILDIGNDRQRETLFNHIEIHLDALKKYTYGKHIVTRFEQLSGEGNGSSDS